MAARLCQAMIQISLMSRSEAEIFDDATRWFSRDGCVVHHADRAEVFMGGTLVGCFDRRELVTRDLLLVNLAKEPRIKNVRLSWAFKL